MTIWTEERTKILKTMWKIDSMREEDITKVLGLSWGAIRTKAYNLRLPPFRERKMPKIDYEYLKRLGITIEG